MRSVLGNILFLRLVQRFKRGAENGQKSQTSVVYGPEVGEVFQRES